MCQPRLKRYFPKETNTMANAPAPTAPATTATATPAAPAPTAPAYKAKAGENAKKTAAKALGNAILRVQNRLLILDAKVADRFARILEKTKRTITAEREDDDSLKRKFPVQIAAEFAVLGPILNPPVESNDPNAYLKLDENASYLSRLGTVLKGELPTLLKDELPIISCLVEADMRKNVYLGKDMTDEKDKAKNAPAATAAVPATPARA